MKTISFQGWKEHKTIRERGGRHFFVFLSENRFRHLRCNNSSVGSFLEHALHETPWSCMAVDDGHIAAVQLPALAYRKAAEAGKIDPETGCDAVWSVS